MLTLQTGGPGRRRLLAQNAVRGTSLPKPPKATVRSGWVTVKETTPSGLSPSKQPAWATYAAFTPYPEHRKISQQPKG